MLNLSALKNVIEKLTPTLPAEPPSASPSLADLTIAAQVVKKQKQLLQGKTAALLDRLRADLDEAQLAREQAETAEGECLVDGRDATAETDAMHRASDHVRALESALKIAIQKDDAAQADLEQAEQDLASAVQEAARQDLLALAEEGEEILIRLKMLRAAVVRAAAAAREVGGIEAWGQRESIDYLTFFLTRANRSAAADAADSGAFMKYPSWTTCLQYVCGKIHP